jgi:hypothetical protein
MRTDPINPTGQGLAAHLQDYRYVLPFKSEDTRGDAESSFQTMIHKRSHRRGRGCLLRELFVPQRRRPWGWRHRRAAHQPKC